MAKLLTSQSMGLNVGGIYIDADKKNITSQKVADFVRSYWLKLGAKKSKKDPLKFPPLQLEKTGFLGFAVGSKVKDKKGKSWIGIYDSERYKADHELAQALKDYFDTDVWIFGVTDSVNQAYATKYGQREKVISEYGKAYSKAAFFPYSFLYFNQLHTLSKKQLKNFIILAFENVPYRPEKDYSGPSPDRLHTNKLMVKARKYIDSRNAEKLLPLSKNDAIYREVIRHFLENSDPSKPKDLVFIWAFHGLVIKKEEGFLSLAEAALRMKEDNKFEQIIHLIPNYSLYELEQRAFEIGKKGEYYLAFRLYEAQLFRTNYQDPRLLNNAVYFLNSVVDNHGISSQRLDELLKKAYQAGPINPPIFHALACFYVKTENYESALDCVENAVRYEYKAIDSLQNDANLDPIKSNPRFQSILAKKV